MPEKKHPIVVEGEKDISKRESLAPFFRDLKDKVFEDGRDRIGWETKQEEFFRFRYAILDQEVTHPWPGASSIIVPIEDMLIDRLKPPLLGLFSNVTPVVSFRELLGAKNKDSARWNEALMEYLLKVRDPDFFSQYGYCLDNVLSMGWGILYMFYEYKTERQILTISREKLPPPLSGFFVLQRGDENFADAVFSGLRQMGIQARPITKKMFHQQSKRIREMVKRAWRLFEDDPVDRKAIDKIMAFLVSGEETVQVEIRQEVSNTSRTVNIQPDDIWVPSHTNALQDATRATIRFTLTAPEIKRRQRDENWNSDAVEQLLNRPALSQTHSHKEARRGHLRSLDYLRDEQEGLFRHHNEETFDFYLTHTYGPFSSSEEFSKGKILWHQDVNIPFKATPLLNNHGHWPVSQLRFELNNGRFYSPRGVCEKIHDQSEELTWQHREKLNNMRIVNSPTFVFETGTNFNPLDIPWTPGQFIEAGRADRVSALSAPDRTLSNEREEINLRNFMEQHIGSPDLALGSLQSGGQDARTATEVDLIDRMGQVVGGFHAQVIQTGGMKEVFYQVWSNWLQWGPDEFTISILGRPPIRLTKADLMGKFEIIPRGTAGNINPAMEARRALEKVTVLAQLKPIVDQDPQARKRIDLIPAIQNWIERDDFDLAQKVLVDIPEEERKQILQQRAQQAATQQAIAQNQQPMPLDELNRQLNIAKSRAPAGGQQLIQI